MSMMEEDTSASCGLNHAASLLNPIPAATRPHVEAVPAPTRAQQEKRLKLKQRVAKHPLLEGEGEMQQSKLKYIHQGLRPAAG